MNAYRSAVDPLEALGDATRRAIVARLREGECSVGDLAAGLPVSRPAVSQHLGVLRAAGLVVERPVGTRRIYRLDPDALGALHARVDAMWGAALIGGAAAASGAPAPAARAAQTGTETRAAATTRGSAATERRPGSAARPSHARSASSAAEAAPGRDGESPRADAAKGSRKKHKKKSGHK